MHVQWEIKAVNKYLALLAVKWVVLLEVSFWADNVLCKTSSPTPSQAFLGN